MRPIRAKNLVDISKNIRAFGYCSVKSQLFYHMIVNRSTMNNTITLYIWNPNALFCLTVSMAIVH